MRYISVKIMAISVRQKIFSLQQVSQPFLKLRKFRLYMRKDFLIMNNFYLVEILSKPNSLTIVTSKKIIKMSNYMLILSIFFLITRIRNFQCVNISLWKSDNPLSKTPVFWKLCEQFVKIGSIHEGFSGFFETSF